MDNNGWRLIRDVETLKPVCVRILEANPRLVSETLTHCRKIGGVSERHSSGLIQVDIFTLGNDIFLVCMDLYLNQLFLRELNKIFKFFLCWYVTEKHDKFNNLLLLHI